MQVRGMLGSVLCLVSLCRVEAVQLTARSMHVAVRERFVEVWHLRYQTSASAKCTTSIVQIASAVRTGGSFCIAKFFAKSFIVRESTPEEKEGNFPNLLGQNILRNQLQSKRMYNVFTVKCKKNGEYQGARTPHLSRLVPHVLTVPVKQDHALEDGRALQAVSGAEASKTSHFSRLDESWPHTACGTRCSL
jgi:hypothetical protein